MEPLLLGLLTAAGGAVMGGAATHWFEQRRDVRQDERALQAKIHDLELRIVRLEAEFVAANRIAQRLIQERSRRA